MAVCVIAVLAELLLGDAAGAIILLAWLILVTLLVRKILDLGVGRSVLVSLIWLGLLIVISMVPTMIIMMLRLP
ncbi:MAG: hypothetical protein ABIE42_09525 [Candidatus Eisenbacteria bacterium]